MNATADRILTTADRRTPEQIARDDQILIERARYAARRRAAEQQERDNAAAYARIRAYWRRA